MQLFAGKAEDHEGLLLRLQTLFKTTRRLVTHEGHMVSLQHTIVSNRELIRHARRLGMQRYLRAFSFYRQAAGADRATRGIIVPQKVAAKARGGRPRPRGRER